MTEDSSVVVKRALFIRGIFKHGGCLAGGAVRDKIMDKPIKDYDVYICIGKLGVVRKLAEACQATYEFDDFDQDSVEYTHNYLLGRMQIKELKLDVLFHDQSSLVIVNSFDIGLCRVYADSNGLHETNEFIKDRQDKTLTVYRSGWGETGVQQHVERLLLKYPDFTVVRKDQDDDTF